MKGKTEKEFKFTYRYKIKNWVVVVLSYIEK